MSDNVDTGLLAVYMDRVEVLISAVLEDQVSRLKAKPLLQRDFAELRAIQGLAEPQVRTGVQRFEPGEAGALAVKVAQMQATGLDTIPEPDAAGS